MHKLLPALLLLLLTACNIPAASTPAATATQSSVTLTPSLTVQPSNTPAPTDTPQPTPTPIPPHRSQYAMTVTYNQKEQHLNVVETLTYTNFSGVDLPELRFVVEPNRAAGQFTLNSLVWNDGRSVEGYTLQGAALTVPLATPLAPERNLTLRFNFDLKLPNEKGIFGYTASQVSLSNWYPFVPPYLPGKGWLVNEPASEGEYLVYDMADYWVNLKFQDASPNLMIAANASAQVSPDGSYTFQLENARHFVWSVLLAHELQQRVVDGITINEYVYPRDEASGEWVLDVAEKSLQFYNQQFGPYPHTTLTIVETDMFDGMEYDGLYYISQGYYNGHKSGATQDYLTTLTAHEIAHQWWFAQVGNDQAHEPWLDEALCAYTELLFYEHYYPGLTDWWWSFRVDYYDPQGFVNSSIYDFYDFRIYVNAIYLRGARFLRDVRAAVGDEAFLATLQDYLQTEKNKIATADDFFAALARHSSADLSVVKANYFK